jgi:hypothetical protein
LLDIKKRLWDYFEGMSSFRDSGVGLASMIYSSLVDSVTDIPNEEVRKRELSMFLDGTMVGYSLQVNLEALSQESSFRVLVEPGGCWVTLPEQINFTLLCINALFSKLKWGGASDDINRIMRLIFPRDPKLLNDWWGGIWLGGDFKESSCDLKIYLNLRNGSLESRWQKIADAFSPYAKGSMKSLFLEVSERSIRLGGIPVGLGLVIIGGVLMGFRIYISLEKPEIDTIISMIPKNIKATPEFRKNLTGLENILGNFDNHSVTVSYDFVLKNKVLSSQIYRFKSDVCFNKFIDNKQSLFNKWLQEHLDDFSNEKFNSFFSGLNSYFGGFDIDYLSLGLKNNNESQLTCYTKPYGMSTENRATHPSC